MTADKVAQPSSKAREIAHEVELNLYTEEGSISESIQSGIDPFVQAAQRVIDGADFVLGCAWCMWTGDDFDDDDEPVPHDKDCAYAALASLLNQYRRKV